MIVQRLVRCARLRAMATFVMFLPMVAALGQDRVGLPQAIVEGMVVNSVTQTPIPDAVVSFESQSGVSRMVVTAEDGRFLIENLPPGRYVLDASASGFTPTRRTGQTTYSLLPGDRATDVRLDLLPTSVITGRALDANRRPIDAAVVTALRIEYQQGIPVLDRPCRFAPDGKNRTQTDDDGNYRLGGLEPGSYYLALEINLAGECVAPPLYYPGMNDPAAALPVELLPGAQLNGMDIVYSERETYTADFSVTLIPGPSRPPQTPSNRFELVRRSLNGLHATIITSTRGRSLIQLSDHQYRIPGLTPGSYELFFSDDGQGRVGRAQFDIVDRDIDVGPVVVGGVQLFGKVNALAGGQGAVGTDAGWSLGSLSVRLHSADRRSPSMTRTLSHVWFPVAADGSFASIWPRSVMLDPYSVAQGRYTASLDGLAGDWYLESVTYGGVQVSDTGFQVDVQSPASLELSVGRGGSLEGLVQTSRGDPVADSEVVLIPASHRRSNSSLFKTAVTDQYGRFSIRAIAPGAYTVLALERIEPGIYENPEFLREFETRGARITVEPGL